MICSQCQTEVVEGAVVCGHCGTLLSTVPPAQSFATGPAGPAPGPTAPLAAPGGATVHYATEEPAATPYSAPASQLPPPVHLATPPGRSGMSPVQLDMNRLTKADRITGVATLVLFIALFLPWFGISGPTVLGVSDGSRSAD